MELRGRVRDGKGHCSRWPEHLTAHYQRISGLPLIPGTLNVELEEAYCLPKTSHRLRASEWNGPHDVLLLGCRVDEHPGVIIRTEPNNQGSGPVPRTVLEIASDARLRVLLGLDSGDSVVVHVDS